MRREYFSTETKCEDICGKDCRRSEKSLYRFFRLVLFFLFLQSNLIRRFELFNVMTRLQGLHPSPAPSMMSVTSEKQIVLLSDTGQKWNFPLPGNIILFNLISGSGGSWRCFEVEMLFPTLVQNVTSEDNEVFQLFWCDFPSVHVRFCTMI